MLTPNEWVAVLRVAWYCGRCSKERGRLQANAASKAAWNQEMKALVRRLSTVYWPYPTLKVNNRERANVSH